MRGGLQPSRVIRWGVPLLACASLWASGPMWRYVHEAIRYPYQLDPIESKVLQHALWLNEGHPIYFDLGPEPPWVVGNYPPLFPYLCSLGIDAPDFAFPRMLTAASTLIAGLALAFLVWYASRSISLGLLGAGLWWSTYEVHHWAPLCRVDMPALALSALGLVGAAISIRWWTWSRLLIVCCLFWLAWLTRQTAILMPIAVLLWLFATDRRWAIRFAAVWLGGLLLIMGGMVWLTDGAFWRLTVGANVNSWSWWQTWIWVKHVALITWPAGILALIFGLLGTSSVPITDEERWRPAVREVRGLLLLSLLLNLVNVLATGKVGADKNYLLEPLWCLAALLATLWGHIEIRSRRGSGRRLFMLMSLAMVGLVIWTVHNPLIPQRSFLRGVFPNRDSWRSPISDADLRRDFQIEGMVQRADGPVLSEYGIYVLRAGQDLIHEPFLMSQLALEGVWDEEPLLEGIRRGDYALIIAEDDLENPEAFYLSATPAFAEAVRESCDLVRVSEGTITQRIWRPRSHGR